MKQRIQKVPVPICGVMLGVAALGNLLQSYSEGLRLFCGILSGVLLLCIVCKVILYPSLVRNDLKNPIMASVAATLPMALMLQSVYIKPWIGQGAFWLWVVAILLHIVLILYFTVHFIVGMKLTNVYASYFIVYVGIAMAAITAPAYGHLEIGVMSLFIGFISLVILLALVSLRYVKHREIPEPAKSLICIYAAPTSLCIVGYIQTVTNKSYVFLLCLLIVATVLYVFSLVKAIEYLKFSFYPSMASFTFPFVISAIATKQTNACLIQMGHAVSGLSTVVLFETVIATVFVSYTLIRYVYYLSKTE